MERHTSRPEKSGRLYYNEDFTENPASGPLGMRAIRPDYTRQAGLMCATDELLLRIDQTIIEMREGAGTPPAPEVQPPEIEAEEDLVELESHRRVLGRSALRYTA